MRWLPRSLLGRVVTLYAATLLGVALLGLTLFLWQQAERLVADAANDADALLALVAPVARDSAVIGDYDTIGRQLRGMAEQSTLVTAEFSDGAGGHLVERRRRDAASSPDWLERWLGGRLGARTAPVEAGGRTYGMLRIVPDTAEMAGRLWSQALGAALLSLAGVALGLGVILPPLARWLGQLERIGELGSGLDGARQLAHRAMASDAPVEFRRTFQVLERAATSLQEQREQAAATLQAIDDAVLACNMDGRVVLANEAAERLLQRPAAAIVGQPLQQLMPALADIGTLAPGAAWQHRSLEWVGPGGDAHVLDANLSPIVDEAGRTAGRVLACRDVTEQHRQDQALRALHAARDAALAALRRGLEAGGEGGDAQGANLADIEAVSLHVTRLLRRLQEHGEQLDAIFLLSPDGFVSFDAERRVRYASRGFVRLTGLSSEMVLGLEEDVFLHRLGMRCGGPAESARLARLGEASRSGRRVTVTLARPQRRVVELALHHGSGGTVSQLLHLRDVTRETEVERLKSEFVAAAAHELRTPMVGIYGYSELLVARELPPHRQKQLLATIHRQCEVMVDILNEMLDLARMEARQGSDFEFDEVRLDGVVDATLADFCPPADRTAPSWRASRLAGRVRADPVKLQRALRNLLSNAYKYSAAPAPVELAVVSDPGRARMGVAVTDHGIGMNAEQLARVGERFWRADESGTVLGTGLGMSLVREIVSLHDGELALQSVPGAGTTVTLWLPLVLPGAQPPGGDDESPAEPAAAPGNDPVPGAPR